MDTKRLAQDIQNVISTLESLNIPSTYDNMNKMLGCMQCLAHVRDEVQKIGTEKETDVVQG